MQSMIQSQESTLYYRQPLVSRLNPFTWAKVAQLTHIQSNSVSLKFQLKTFFLRTENPELEKNSSLVAHLVERPSENLEHFFKDNIYTCQRLKPDLSKF